MPKAPSRLPVSGLFAVCKPSGPPSMAIVNQIKPLIARSRLFVETEKLTVAKQQKGRGRNYNTKYGREAVKIGQGGTLDPLADGVLVIGVGKATKNLSFFLDCVKEYRTTCLLGCETDSYDSEGKQVRLAPWKHVTREKVEAALEQFRGEITQAPPIFSALKMDGKPLYEYARNGEPLPRPIDRRKVTVHSIVLEEWLGDTHTFRWPEKKFTDDERRAVEKALSSVELDPTIQLEADGLHDQGAVPTAFVLQMKVSGGTYVRSIVHDLAHAIGSAGHVVTLTRSRQGRYTLEPNADDDLGCVPWNVFTKAAEDPGEPDADGWVEWEQEVMNKLQIVDGK